MSTKVPPHSVYHLKVTLEDSKPPIWRDVLVPSDLTLDHLHYVIQAVMGWSNCHLHHFIAEKIFYKGADDDNYSLDASYKDDYERDEKDYTVSQLLTKEKASIIYEYDLGDSWTHKIELKKILPIDANARQPRCIKGKQACPPEDCGGVWGYGDMLETIQDAKNPEREEVLQWLGDDFNPDYFDLDAVNNVLKHLLV